MKRRNLLAGAVTGLLLASGASFAQGMDKVKACFVYVGPIDRKSVV